MKRIAMATALLVLPLDDVRAESGQAIFARSCATCHFTQRDPARRDEMVAPPIDMLSARLRQVTGNDRAAFINRVVAYVRHPDAAKSVDPMAVQRFGLMPAIGDTFPDLKDAELQDVAGWMFDAHAGTRLPAGAGTGMGMGGGQRGRP